LLAADIHHGGPEMFGQFDKCWHYGLFADRNTAPFLPERRSTEGQYWQETGKP
jgi:hypothetical protein